MPNGLMALTSAVGKGPLVLSAETCLVRVCYSGNSETGAVALLFAATYPEWTRAVVGYGTYGAGGGDTEPTYPWVPDPADEESYDEIARMSYWPPLRGRRRRRRCRTEWRPGVVRSVRSSTSGLTHRTG